MKKLASSIISIGLIAILIGRVVTDWETTSLIDWQLSISRLTLFVVLLVGIYGSNVLSWHILTKYLRAKISLKENISIWLLSNLVRLLPGGIWQYPSRVLLLSQKGVKKSIGLYAVVLEIVFSLVIGSAITVATLPYWSLSDEILGDTIVWFSFGILFVLLVLLTQQSVIRFLSGLYLKITGKHVQLKDIDMNSSFLLPMVVVFAMRFVFIGSAFFVLLSMIQPLPISDFVDVLGMYSFSWLIGFVTVFAPGGIGVTEGVLTVTLATIVPSSIAAAAAIVFRVALLVTEGILVGVVKSSSAFRVTKNT